MQHLEPMPGITPIPTKGFGTKQARAYFLLSAGHDTAEQYGWPRDMHVRARALWRRFAARHPEFISPMVGAD